jgi:hypothetical protein
MCSIASCVLVLVCACMQAAYNHGHWHNRAVYCPGSRFHDADQLLPIRKWCETWLAYGSRQVALHVRVLGIWCYKALHLRPRVVFGNHDSTLTSGCHPVGYDPAPYCQVLAGVRPIVGKARRLVGHPGNSQDVSCGLPACVAVSMAANARHPSAYTYSSVWGNVPLVAALICIGSLHTAHICSPFFFLQNHIS